MNGADMNDPHVEKLYYRVIIPEHTDYDKAPPISGETDDFGWHLSKEQLVLECKPHFASENEARAVADSFLKAWEVSIGLRQSPRDLTFKFQSSSIIDRSPTQQAGTQLYEVVASGGAVVSGQADADVSYAQFPVPCYVFKVSPEVEMMHFRYMLYRKNRESLLGMSFWCATVIKYHFKGYSQASKKLQVSMNVLTKLSFLSSNRGDPKEARKMEGQAGSTPLSSTERMWIEAVIPKLILRVGEHAHDPSAKLPQITMSDLPTIS
jgi:hypothetical protein